MNDVCKQIKGKFADFAPWSSRPEERRFDGIGGQGKVYFVPNLKSRLPGKSRGSQLFILSGGIMGEFCSCFFI